MPPSLLSMIAPLLLFCPPVFVRSRASPPSRQLFALFLCRLLRFLFVSSAAMRGAGEREVAAAADLSMNLPRTAIKIALCVRLCADIYGMKAAHAHTPTRRRSSFLGSSWLAAVRPLSGLQCSFVLRAEFANKCVHASSLGHLLSLAAPLIYRSRGPGGLLSLFTGDDFCFVVLRFCVFFMQGRALTSGGINVVFLFGEGK